MAPAAADSASEAANPDSAVKKEPSAERNVLPDSTEDAVVAKPKVCRGFDKVTLLWEVAPKGPIHKKTFVTRFVTKVKFEKEI